MERVWLAAARLEGDSVELYPPLKARPSSDETARVLLIDSSGPRSWAEWPPGTFSREAIAARFADLPPPTAKLPPEPQGSLAVAVCTRDRPAMLASCLLHLGHLEEVAKEIIVVDNAPTSDASKMVVESAQEHGVNVRRVVEKEPGVSRARNRAIRETDCDFVAFTDDDALADPQWARGLLRGFSRSENVGIVTGLVPPAELMSPAQAWFQERLKWSRTLEPCVYSPKGGHDYGWPFPYSAGHFGTGANFAIRRDIALELGGFREYLGPGTRTEAGEDMELFVRSVIKGYDLVFEPAAIVWHQHRRAERDLNRLLFGYGKGLSAVFVTNLIAGDRWRVVSQHASGLRDLMSERAADVQGGSPGFHTVIEIAGALYGPVALAREHADNALARRRQRRGVRPS